MPNIVLDKEQHNYIVFNQYGKIKEKNLFDLSAGSSGIEIYILADFDNVEASEYETYANIKRPDGLIVGDVILEKLANQIDLNGNLYWGKKLTLYDDVTQLNGAIQISIVYSKFDSNLRKIKQRINGMIVFHIYDAVSFYTPRSSVINAMMRYVDQQALGGGLTYGAKALAIPINSPEPSVAPDIPATAQVVYITPIPKNKTTHSVLNTKIIPLSEIGSGVSQAVKLGYDATDSRVYKGNGNTKLWVEWYEDGYADTHDLVIYFQ